MKTAKDRNHDHARKVRQKRQQNRLARADYIAALNNAQRNGPQAAESAGKEYYPLLEELYKSEHE